MLSATLEPRKLMESAPLATHTGMNMQYAEAVIAHEPVQRRRLALTPNVTHPVPADVRWAARAAAHPFELPRWLVCH